MTTSIALKAVSGGTDMIAVVQGIAAVIPVERCYRGWQHSLMLPGRLVEAEVKQ